MHKINAAEFQARCLALLDEVAKTGETVVILKRGKPVARLVPPAATQRLTRPARTPRFPQAELRGSVVIKGDVVEPVLPPEAWDAESGR